jgi:hypothetical protein
MLPEPETRPFAKVLLDRGLADEDDELNLTTPSNLTMIPRVRYPGGKGKCFQRLINLMPPHDVYIESHLGGGAVLRNKRPAEVNIGIDIDPRVIQHWRSTLGGDFTLIQADATAYLSNYPFQGRELIYSDPPYLPEVRRRRKVYRFDFSARDHEVLLDVIKSIPCMAMISGYANHLYDDTLKNWERVSFPAKTHVGVRQEVVWMNFSPPIRLHDSTHFGETFRNRQSFRRRQTRMIEKFARMPAQERAALLYELNSNFGSAMEVP